MSVKTYVLDTNAKQVFVGSFVKVLEIDSAIRLEDAASKDILSSMLGAILEVEVIDEFGCAWVTKRSPVCDSGDYIAESIALESHQMELAEQPNRS